MTIKNYTFALPAGGRTRHNAGSYDQQTGTPSYELDFFAPFPEVLHKIEVSQFLMGNEGSRLWVWDIENKSTWDVFAIVKKDGVVVAPLIPEGPGHLG